MLFVSKNCSLEKVAIMNSSCFIICELNWIVFMAKVMHFRVKMRSAFFYCANLIILVNQQWRRKWIATRMAF